MFAISLACLLLTIPGQAGAYDSDTEPQILIGKVNQAVVKGDLLEVLGLQHAIAGALKKTKSTYQKKELEEAFWELKNCEKKLSDKKMILSNSNNKRNKDIALLSSATVKALLESKENFLALRGEIEKALKSSENQAQIDQMAQFTMGRILADMDRLTELDRDPAKRVETNNFFALIYKEMPPDLTYPPEGTKSALVKRISQIQSEASRLFGPTSYIRLAFLGGALNALANECLKGQMPDIDLETEIQKEFAPFLNSDWANNISFQSEYYRPLAKAYLSPKGKDHNKLAEVIEKLEGLNSEFGEPDSYYFLDTISYRLMMLSQQERHQECLAQFKKITANHLHNAPPKYKLDQIDIHLCAARSYEALGIKESALLQQELAFGLCLECGPIHFSLSRFKRSVAQELRDKYAKNNQWKEARNLEERCQLLGLTFDPLPKQPFE